MEEDEGGGGGIICLELFNEMLVLEDETTSSIGVSWA